MVFFFFLVKKNLSTFINVNELHPNVKPKQYEEVHLPSILDNLVCLCMSCQIMSFTIVISLYMRIQHSLKMTRLNFHILHQ